MQLTAFLSDLLDGVKNVAAALAPAAIGASVAQAYARGLAWRDRLVQFGVGIAVSWYGTLFAHELVGFNDFVAQAVGFVIAMIAYQATPKLIEGSAAVVGTLPAELRDRLFALLPSSKKEIEP